MQIQFCDEGSSIQKLKAVVSEDGYYTEIEWNIMVTIWVEPQSENWLFSIITSPTGMIGIVTFLIALLTTSFHRSTKIHLGQKAESYPCSRD